MAFQPGLPGSQFPSEDALIRRIQDLEKAVQQLAAANPFAPMGIAPSADGFTVTGSETVNGSLTVNGPAVITGTLSLPAGIIGNDALASPVTFGQSSTAQTNFALATTDTTLAVGSIAVPAGYTQALVFAVVSVGAINPNTAADFLYTKAVINGVASNQSFGYVSGSNGSVETVSAKSAALTGLSGGSISVALTCHTQANAFAADASNRAYVDAQVVFIR